jgi:phosphoglycerate dehydrogenase-like enzyme
MGLEKAFPELQKEFPQVAFSFCAKTEDMVTAITDAEIYVGWLTREVFLAAKALKWVQSPSSGIDYYLKIPELAEGDVILCSASGTHAVPLAESALAMILAFTRGIRASVLDQPKHAWRMREIRSSLTELTGTTLGIVGLGRVGRALAQRAAAFDMKIIAVDVSPRNKPDHVHALWGLDGLPDLMRQSDFVVVTAPGTHDSRGMIGDAEFALMKPTAMMIGISRGGVVNQDALVKALKEKKIAAAAMDVFVPEPLPADSELRDIPNLLVTAHIAGGTQYEGEYIIEILRENLGKYLCGDFPLRNQVDKNLGF